MAINLEYGDSFKRATLVSVMEAMRTELFSLCLQSGIDPETLDISNPNSDPKISGASETDFNYHAINRIKQVCEGYALAKEKLDNLS